MPHSPSLPTVPYVLSGVRFTDRLSSNTAPARSQCYLGVTQVEVMLLQAKPLTLSTYVISEGLLLCSQQETIWLLISFVSGSCEDVSLIALVIDSLWAQQ